MPVTTASLSGTTARAVARSGLASGMLATLKRDAFLWVSRYRLSPSTSKAVTSSALSAVRQPRWRAEVRAVYDVPRLLAGRELDDVKNTLLRATDRDAVGNVLVVRRCREIVDRVMLALGCRQFVRIDQKALVSCETLACVQLGNILVGFALQVIHVVAGDLDRSDARGSRIAERRHFLQHGIALGNFRQRVARVVGLRLHPIRDLGVFHVLHV